MVSTQTDSTAPHHVEVLAGQRTGGWRYFFVVLGVLYALVALAGFVPAYHRYFEGLRDLHWATHVHGAIMGAWIALFIAQASLAASNSPALHRRVGVAGFVLAALVWLSMCVVSVRVRTSPVPPVDSFLWDVLLIELMLIVLVPIFTISGLRARRSPQVHKRLMVFALAVALQASIDRIRWLPKPDLPVHWGSDLYVYLLLLPLIAFDFAQVGRIRRITALGFAALFAGHIVVNSLWGSPAWHRLVHAVFSRFT